MRDTATYYNEWDEPTAAWLRELGARRHLPAGHVDTQSIRNVRASDVAGYDQCHFFAGIGGWPLALRWAGLEGVPGIWTGSPPCQPFSVAGQRLGKDDERHLAPTWLGLVRECRPVLVLGEQVADAIKTGWLDDLFDALEREGYACGAAVLPACGVGAPHIRKRLFFGAIRLADTHGWDACAEWQQRSWQHRQFSQDGGACGLADGAREQRNGCRSQWQRRGAEPAIGVGTRGLADLHRDRCGAGREIRSVRAEHDAEHGSSTGRLADSGSAGLERQPWHGDDGTRRPQPARSASESRASDSMDRRGRPNPDHGFWSGADWLGCRDGKCRPVESGTQPLATGLSARVGRLRGYGNAIVPQLAAIFITEFLGAVAEMHEIGE